MREIKFRFYQKTHKQMCGWDYVKGYKVAALEDNQDGESYSSWMQFTGIRDRNDKDIYEGDIIQVEGRTQFRIYYSDTSACFRVERIRDGWHFDLKELFPIDNWEVVGNIYENPELLGK